MKIHLPLRDVRVGMFLEAEVRTLFVEGEMRHFLELTDAKYAAATTKRLRLMKRRFEQVANAGGMLVSSRKQLSALEQIGVSEVVINTDKSDVIPDLPETAAIRDRPSAAPPPAEEGPGPLTARDDSWVRNLHGLEGVDVPSTAAPPEEPGRAQRVRRVDVAGTDRRRNFGPSNTGWMKLEVADTDDDGAPRLCAYLQVISFGGDGRMGAADVFRGLEEQFGIRAGLDEAMVKRLAEQAAASPNRVIRGRFLIASSPRRDPTLTGRLEYSCLDGIDDELPFARLRQAFAATRKEDAADSRLRVRAVGAGEELAVFVPAGEVDGPPDIFGNTRPPTGAASLLRAGDNVRLDEDRYLSTSFGYVCIHDGEISVIPPLWIDPDHMEAHYLYLPDATDDGLALTRDDLSQLLEARDVVFGLREEAIDQLLADPPSGDRARAVLLAAGTRARRGEDAQIRWALPAHEAIDPYDVAARHEAARVRAGQLLAEVHAATAGKSGVDLAGRAIEGEAGSEAFLIPDDNVRCEDGDDVQQLFAEVEGSLQVNERTVRVRPVVYVRGSIDAPFKVKPGSDVYIRGSVRSGGTVEADGTISVEGSIEGGAIVHSQQDVHVGRGIIGHGTRVVARTDVAARFVQGGSVIAGGDVAATQLMNATVRASNLTVTGVEGEERSGAIIGGQTLVTGRVEALRAGSQTMTETHIRVVGDPQMQAQLNKLDKGLDFCRTNIVRILRTLGVRQIDAVQLKSLIDKAPPEKRKPLIKILTQLKQLVQTRDRSTRMRRSLEEDQQRLLAEAEIHIRDLVHADVHIHIGERVLQPKENIEGGAVFRLQGKHVAWSPPESTE